MTPSDFRCFANKLQFFNDNFNFEGECITQGENLFLPYFTLSDGNQNIHLKANAKVQNLTSTPSVSINGIQLKTSKNIQQFLTKNLQGEERELSPFLSNAGNISTDRKSVVEGKSV